MQDGDHGTKSTAPKMGLVREAPVVSAVASAVVVLFCTLVDSMVHVLAVGLVGAECGGETRAQRVFDFRAFRSMCVCVSVRVCVSRCDCARACVCSRSELWCGAVQYGVCVAQESVRVRARTRTHVYIRMVCVVRIVHKVRVHLHFCVCVCVFQWPRYWLGAP